MVPITYIQPLDIGKRIRIIDAKTEIIGYLRDFSTETYWDEIGSDTGERQIVVSLRGINVHVDHFEGLVSVNALVEYLE